MAIDSDLLLGLLLCVLVLAILLGRHVVIKVNKVGVFEIKGRQPAKPKECDDKGGA